MGGGKGSWSKRSQVLVVFALLLLVFAGALLFGAVLFQEGNPIPVLRAVVRVESSGDTLVRFSDEPVKFLQKAGKPEPLHEYLSHRGWGFQDQMGAVIFYEKDGETLTAEMRMFTQRYVVYELDGEP